MRRILALLASAALLTAATIVGSPLRAEAGGPTISSFNSLWMAQPFAVNGAYQPLVGANSCLADSGFVLWYAPGTAPDYLWTFSEFSPFTYTVIPRPVNGTYEPLVGDFDDDGCDDILWYAPGSAPDSLWFNDGDGTFTSVPITINGTYQPVVAEFDGGGDDIFWYAPGSGAESQWRGRPDRTFDKSSAPNVNGTYRLAAFSDVLLFHAPGSAPDYTWEGLAPGASAADTTTQVAINGTYEPVAVGLGFLLYAAGPSGDYLVTGIDSSGRLQTIPGTINGTYTTGISSLALQPFPLWHAPGPAGDYLWTRNAGKPARGWARTAPQSSFTLSPT